MASPEDWVRNYLDLTVPVLQVSGQSILPGPTTPVPITRYANAAHPSFQGPRNHANSALQGWVRGPARRLGVTMNGEQVQLLIAAPIRTTLGSIHRVFLGKATPTEIVAALRLLSLWVASDSRVLPGLGVPDLRTFADRFVGMDCNGFVGTYLKENHPESGLGPNFYIPAVSAHTTARLTVPQVQELDLIVSQGTGHVAIIGHISRRTDTEVVCNVCQSRSETLGGVHTGEVTIRHRGTSFVMNHEEITGIYGIRNS